MSKKIPLQKLSIVFEDNGTNDGNGFNVYISGMRKGLELLNPEQMSPAEIWANRIFAIVGQILRQEGVVEREIFLDSSGPLAH